MARKYVHTNLIARDWRRLSDFYQKVFGCRPLLPERELSGKWLDRGTGVSNASIAGVHLLLPGHGDDGPTLELFQYGSMPHHPPVRPNTPGFSHLAFAVDNVASTAQTVFSNGGSPVGELVQHKVSGVGVITFQYVADPEGNILELQQWQTLPSDEPGPDL
jgi:predicted enzyme related to lactoylglutathione lyase